MKFLTCLMQKLQKKEKKTVPHLVSLNGRQQTLITLYQHSYVDKGWGTGVPHLVGLSRIIVGVPHLVDLRRIISKHHVYAKGTQTKTTKKRH